MSTTTEVAVRSNLPTAMQAKLSYAKALAKSGLLPRDYRERPENVLFACEYGEMLGLPPMAAINGIHVIDGKPTASAALISALVRRAGHKLRVTGDGRKATAQIIRADDPGFTYEATWDLPRAVQAGLCQIKDGKPFARDSKGKPLPWEKYTAAMLKARAVTEVSRDACEEALCGMHYTPEELGAYVTDEGDIIQGEIVREAAADPAVAELLAEAETFADDAAGQALWKKVVDEVHAGELTKQAGGSIQDVIKARWSQLTIRAGAAAGAADDEIADAEIVTPDGDEWAQAIAGITEWPEAERLLGDLEKADMADDRRAQITGAIEARVTSLTGAAA